MSMNFKDVDEQEGQEQTNVDSKNHNRLSTYSSMNETPFLTDQSTGDDGFLKHLHSLEEAIKSAKAEESRLQSEREQLAARLVRVRNEKNLTGNKAMSNLSREAGLKARMYANNVERAALELRFNRAQSDEAAIRAALSELAELGKGLFTDGVTTNLTESRDRMIEAAEYFDRQDIVGDSLDTGMTWFEVDRARNLLVLARQQLDQCQAALQDSQKKEASMIEKHEQELRKFENDDPFV